MTAIEAIEKRISFSFNCERRNTSCVCSFIYANIDGIKLPLSAMDSALINVMPERVNSQPIDVGVVPLVTRATQSPSRFTSQSCGMGPRGESLNFTVFISRSSFRILWIVSTGLVTTTMFYYTFRFQACYCPHY